MPDRDSAPDPLHAAPASAAVPSKRVLRQAHLAARRALPADPARDACLAARIGAVLAERAPRCVGFYWPMQGEYDTRALLTEWLAADTTRSAALPEAAQTDSALVFLCWTPEAPMRADRFGILVPAAGTPVIPDLLLIPCVAFDPAGYRLGYGGGFYDRTLATLNPRPYTLGIAHECARVAALPNAPHDIPLDAIVTELARYGKPAPSSAQGRA